MILLPPEYLKDSLSTYIYKHTTRSQIIYWVVLAALVAVIVALPLIYVNVTVQEAGMIRPINERAEVKAPISELVDSVYVREGAKVQKGDTILQFRTGNIQSKQQFLHQKLADVNAQISDLQNLLSGKTPARFASGVRAQENAYFSKRRKELETLLTKNNTEFARNKQLHTKDVISDNEYEQYAYAKQKTENELSSLMNNQLSVWQTDLNNLQMTRKELVSTLSQLREDKDFHFLQVPMSGTVEQFTGIYAGSAISAGQTVAVISPDSTLFIEVYVSPRNIGYIQKDMPVNVQIESFDYNQWGTVSGYVTDISSDFYFDANSKSSYYKVKCALDKNYLTLKNGTKGYLKKGMTARAHFILTRRSLFQLLYQKMDDWLNPTQYNS